MIKLENLTVVYDKVPVLDGLNLEIEEGKVHGVVGFNGSGKSTLFNCIFGYLKPKFGIKLRDEVELKKSDISYLETHDYFYSNITAREYINLFPDMAGNFKLDAWQELFKLPLDQLIDTYSTGMKKKLALLSILKLNKPIIILDEPFNGVDLETTKIFQLIIFKLKEKGKTIILSSHILESLVSVCDYVHLLGDKKIKQSYSKNELIKLDQDMFGSMQKDLNEFLDKAL